MKKENKSLDQKPNRPQEPKPPYPYHVHDVTYKNESDDITLAGTLTVPDSPGQHPAVILVSGMGPSDRDYTMLDHKLFLVLADYLTRQGIAVLRYDKRGIGQSTGFFDTTVTSEDLARDVVAGIQYLKTRKEIDPQKIGLIGHSEGGMIAAMVVADKKNDVAFLVSLAGVAVTDIDSLIKKVGMQLRADGATEQMIAIDKKMRRHLFEAAKHEPDYATAQKKMETIIDQYLQKLPDAQKMQAKQLAFAINEENAEQVIALLNSPWYRYFLTYDPKKALKKITIPVLAVNGDLDFITSSKLSLPVIEQALKEAKNKDYKVVELPNMNHWFQTCATGAMPEYGALEETMSPVVMQMVAEWILKRG